MQLVNIGAQTEIYIPAELCDILLNQPHRGKLSTEQAILMSTVARRPPTINGESIVNLVRHHFGLDVIRPELQSFGITIGPDMAVVPGRILPKPGITYASSAAASISARASWNLVGIKFAIGAHLDNWAVLVIKDNAPSEFAGPLDQDLRDIVSGFRHICNASGMQITADPRYATAQLPGRDPSDPLRLAAVQIIQDTLLNVKPKPALILVMLASGDGAIYEGVKHLCDVRLDVATVCVQSSKIRRRNPHYLANVALKVNMKLGGVNHKLDADSQGWLNDAPTMIVGMDVTHPSPGSPVGSRKNRLFPLCILFDAHLHPTSIHRGRRGKR